MTTVIAESIPTTSSYRSGISRLSENMIWEQLRNGIATLNQQLVGTCQLLAIPASSIDLERAGEVPGIDLELLERVKLLNAEYSDRQQRTQGVPRQSGDRPAIESSSRSARRQGRYNIGEGRSKDASDHDSSEDEEPAFKQAEEAIAA